MGEEAGWVGEIANQAHFSPEASLNWYCLHLYNMEPGDLLLELNFVCFMSFFGLFLFLDFDLMSDL